MNFKWEVAKYNITFKDKLKSKKLSKAAYLLRCTNSSGAVGYADYSSVNLHLLKEALRHSLRGSEHAQAKQSIDFASKDLKADVDGEPVFSPQFSINNHYLISDIESFLFSDLDQLWFQGYRSLKIKIVEDMDLLINFFNKLSKKTNYPFLLRLDFNASVDKNFAYLFLDRLQGTLKDSLLSVEFLEDPLPYNKTEWKLLKKRYNYPLAIDLEWNNFLLNEDLLGLKQEGCLSKFSDLQRDLAFDVMVLKPAVQEVFGLVSCFLNQGMKFVLTHYMDHSLGRLHAIRCMDELISLYSKNVFLDAGLNSFSAEDDNLDWTSYFSATVSLLSLEKNLLSFKYSIDPTLLKWRVL